jgi:hypothetical protein
MYYREEPTEFERRWLELVEHRSEWQGEWKRLRRLARYRRLYSLGMIGLGLGVGLIAGVVVFIVLLLVLHLLFLL